jgi:hypothetical protein
MPPSEAGAAKQAAPQALDSQAPPLPERPAGADQFLEPPPARIEIDGAVDSLPDVAPPRDVPPSIQEKAPAPARAPQHLEVRRLSPEEKQRRRRRRSIFMLIFGLAVLCLALAILLRL